METYSPTIKKWYEMPWLAMLAGMIPRRTTWKTSLIKSGLPAEVQDRVRAVVSRTRLWRLEKIEVCEELISHFEDGHGGGAEFTELLEQFGEPGVAARLIRRAKKRNRSLLLVSVRGILGCGLVFALFYGVFAIYVVLGVASPETDYVKILNSVAINAKEDDRAWPIYREAWIQYGFCNNDERHTKIFGAMYHGTSDQLVEPGDENWPQVVNLLQGYRDMLDQFRTAGAKPALGFVLSSGEKTLSIRDQLALRPRWFDARGKRKEGRSGGIVESDLNQEFVETLLGSLLLPQLTYLRRCARFLKQDTQVAVEENDPERAISNMRAVFGISGHLSECSVMVGSLNALSVSDVGFEQIEYAINRRPEIFSVSQLREIQSLVDSVALRRLLNFEGERLMAYDCLQRCYTDDGFGSGRVTKRGYQAFGYIASGRRRSVPELGIVSHTIGLPVKLFMLASRGETRETYDEIMDAAEAAFDAPGEAYHFDIEDHVSLEQLNGRLRFISVFCPNFEDVRTAYLHAVERRAAVGSMIEVELLRRENGED